MATYSTLAAARTAYLENSDWSDGAGDIASARAFRTACRALKVLLPAQSSKGGASLSMEVAQIENEMARVERWLALNDSAQTQASVRTLVPDLRFTRTGPV